MTIRWKAFLVALAMSVAAAVPAYAATTKTLNWSWTDILLLDTGQPLGDAALSGGKLVITGNSGSSHTVLSITGTWQGSNITGLLPVNTFFGNDNMIFDVPPTLALLDSAGISFSVTGGITVNIRYNGGPSDSLAGAAQDVPCCYAYFDSNSRQSAGVFDAAPTPEPASMALLAGGLLGLGAIRRRK